MGLKVQKRHLQTMEFKVRKNYQQIIHFSFSSHHAKLHHGKISLGLRVLDLNSKV
jgi:hypothetical protein